jgi:hypothetical protein
MCLSSSEFYGGVFNVNIYPIITNFLDMSIDINILVVEGFFDASCLLITTEKARKKIVEDIATGIK